MLKVMLVDDNPISIEGIKNNVNWESLNLTVSQVHYNGNSALEGLHADSVDIIISDIKMPDLDGLSLSEHALNINPFIKVLLISAYDKFEYAKSALQLGVFDYIEKPINYDYLSKQLSDAISQIHREKTNAKLIEQSRPIMIEKFYRELLHSTPREAEFRLFSYENYLNLSFNYNYYLVILVDIQNKESIKKETSISQFEMLLYNLQDTIKAYSKIFDLCYILREFDSFAIIVCQNSSNPKHISESIYKISGLLTDKYNSLGISLSISIGNIVREIWKLGLSYENAKQALEYRFFFPQKNIFDAREVFHNDYPVNAVINTCDDELIKLICQKDEANIVAWIRQFQQELSVFPKNLFFIKIHSLLGKILKFIYELNFNTSQLQDMIIQKYGHLELFSSMDELFSWLTHVCIIICRNLDSSLSTYHKQLCQAVLKYIEENCSNSDLCLNDLAKYVNVSPAYLSALFKKTENYSISDAITNSRINMACQLLTTTNLPLKDISEKCGYANQYYFSTTFKKKKKVTPSAYRNAN